MPGISYFMRLLYDKLWIIYQWGPDRSQGSLIDAIPTPRMMKTAILGTRVHIHATGQMISAKGITPATMSIPHSRPEQYYFNYNIHLTLSST